MLPWGWCLACLAACWSAGCLAREGSGCPELAPVIKGGRDQKIPSQIQIQTASQVGSGVRLGWVVQGKYKDRRGDHRHRPMAFDRWQDAVSWCTAPNKQVGALAQTSVRLVAHAAMLWGIHCLAPGHLLTWVCMPVPMHRCIHKHVCAWRSPAPVPACILGLPH